MMQRQRLSCPAQTREEYEALFRLMQPVPPPYFSCPGDPPSLPHRAAFDDGRYNDGLRSQRAIVKGRFQGGTVGYVRADELELYAAAYKKEIGPLTARQRRIMDMLMSEGPLTCGIIKAETGMLAREIMPELHRLQEAFLVYEDQVDSDWDRGWYVFEREWDGVDVSRYAKTEAISPILMKFLYLNVFAAAEGMKSGLRLPAKDIATALQALEAAGEIVPAAVGGEEGWMLPADRGALERGAVHGMEPSVFVLHRADFLVRAEEHKLKERFAGLAVLQYILIDGEFQGAVLGHWRQGPHDVEDVRLLLHEREKAARKREILDAVSRFYSPPFSFIRRYAGEELRAAGDP